MTTNDPRPENSPETPESTAVPFDGNVADRGRPTPYGGRPGVHGAYAGPGGYDPDSAYPSPASEPQYVSEYPYGYGSGYQGGPAGGYPSAPMGGYAYPPAYGGTPGYPAGYSAPSMYGTAAGGYGYVYPGWPAAPPVGAAPAGGVSARRRALRVAGSVALALALVLAGAGIAEYRHSDTSTTAQLPGTANGGGVTDPGSTGGGSIGGGSTGGGSIGGGLLPGSGGNQNGQSTSAAVATAAQQVGVVTIVSVLGYQTAESAGTGMILSSDGEILTNNHVINGATSITVTVESSGKQYRADVVGTAPTKDVAVLKLRDASGLATAKLDTSASPSVGDPVIGVGNAGGTGTLRAASGKVTALNQSITASDEQGQNAEKLSGLVQTDAGIVSGDSGGPLYNSSGRIIGMDTAASTANSTTQAAYAIPIGTALSVADQIESGTATSVIHIGLPPFIGVTVAETTTGGAAIQTVIAGDPADKAGVTAGSVIIAVGGKSVANAAALKSVLANYKPGDSVSLTWTDVNGARHTATTTLVAGPAD